MDECPILIYLPTSVYTNRRECQSIHITSHYWPYVIFLNHLFKTPRAKVILPALGLLQHATCTWKGHLKPEERELQNASAHCGPRLFTMSGPTMAHHGPIMVHVSPPCASRAKVEEKIKRSLKEDRDCANGPKLSFCHKMMLGAVHILR